VRKVPAGANPWGQGATTLEWTLASPPPFHQFDTLPRVVSPEFGGLDLDAPGSRSRPELITHPHDANR